MAAARNLAGGARDNKGQVKKDFKKVGERLDFLEQRVVRREVLAEQQDAYRRLCVERCTLLEDVWNGFEQKQIPGNELRDRSAATIQEAVKTQLTRQVDEDTAQRKAQESHCPLSPRAKLCHSGLNSKGWSNGSEKIDPEPSTWSWHPASRLAWCMSWYAKSATGLFSSFPKWTTLHPKVCKFTLARAHYRETVRVKAKQKARAKAAKAKRETKLTEKTKAR